MRLATIIVLIGLALFTLVRGAYVVGFSIAKANMFADAAGVDRVQAWQDVAGVEAAARRAARAPLLSATDPKELQVYAHQVKAALEVSPLAPTDWLSLAGLRLILSAPEDDVVSALNMSVLAGPNEGAVMLQRSMFGLLEWEHLPSATHAQTIRDLVGSILDDASSEQANVLLKEALASESSETRSEIQAALREDGINDSQRAQLGLQ
ncbi:MAG TPA: hypothetical protein VMF32_00435 [Xanthobacteraceae bacterium]|nr:hypothetical protein [Xanthobacteraceae bacterium]